MSHAKKVDFAGWLISEVHSFAITQKCMNKLLFTIFKVRAEYPLSRNRILPEAVRRINTDTGTSSLVWHSLHHADTTTLAGQYQSTFLRDVNRK